MADVKERPILMNAEMVRATLDLRKSQTRRVIKPQPKFTSGMGSQIVWKFPKPPAIQCQDVNFMLKRFCPYGKKGDRLWVRETFGFSEIDCEIDFKNDEKFKSRTLVYRSDHTNMVGEKYSGDVKKWKPSIHMPRWASRINLEITDIRVERVRDVGNAEAIAEGIRWKQEAGGSPRVQFSNLWDSINEKRGFGWDVNPWCWCVTFKKL